MSILHIILIALSLLVGSGVFVFVFFHTTLFVWFRVENMIYTSARNKEKMMVGKCYACGYDLTGVPHRIKQREEDSPWWDEYRTCPECGHDETIKDYKYKVSREKYKNRNIDMMNRRNS